MNTQRRQEIAARVEKIRAFCRGVATRAATTSYGEGWREVCQLLLDLEAALTAAETAQQEAIRERDKWKALVKPRDAAFTPEFAGNMLDHMAEHAEELRAKLEAAETRAREAEERADKAEGALEVAEDALRSSQ